MILLSQPDHFPNNLDVKPIALGFRVAVDMIDAPVHDDPEIKHALEAVAHDPGAGLIVMTDSFAVVHRETIVRSAAEHRLPAVYPFRQFVISGGLLSYGVSLLEPWRQAALYVDRILKGEKPADLPVQGPTKFELVLNLKAAKALGLIVPQTLLATADEVIE